MLQSRALSVETTVLSSRDQGAVPVHAAIEARLADSRSEPAVVWGARTLSYGTLIDWASRVSRVLHDVGVRAGDHVGLAFNRTGEYAAAVLGTLRAGATCV